MLRVVVDSKEFSVEAEYDGDFWFVKVFAHEQGDKRHRFTYKINYPKDEDAACQRRWELFEQRHLGHTPT